MTETGGSIYDLGYRRYEGVRLGRGYAILSLYVSSLRAAFGIGRGPWAKVFSIGLAALAFLPAVIQLGIAALVPGNVEIYEAESYYNNTRVVLVLFCGAVAPEMVGRDQRYRTLALYFSRALLRSDYALAKLAAFASALLFLTLAPLLLLYIGNALAAADFWRYMEQEWEQAFPIVVSAAQASTFLAAISLAIAAQSPRRSYTTIAIIALILISGAISGILTAVAEGLAAQVSVLCSPYSILQGATYWFFDASPAPGEQVDIVGVPGWLYAGAATGWTVVGVGVLLRRYARVNA